MILYAIKTRRGEIALPTLRASKRKCLSDYMALPGNKKVTWRQLRRWGWSCVPVRLTMVKNPGGDGARRASPAEPTGGER